jgi:hypothetical protein
LEGHSRLPLPVLEPSLASFWHILPTAVLNGFFQPLPGSGGQSVYLVFSLELLAIWVIVLLSLYQWLKLRTQNSKLITHNSKFSTSASGFAGCCLFFSFSGMLLIGYTIPFAGAIVRYRSIYLPFLLAPCLHLLRDHPLVKKANKGLAQWFGGLSN